MKKFFLLALSFVITFASFGQKKGNDFVSLTKSELTPKSVWAELGGNFVATDINGVEHDMQAYLDAGKTIIIDFSAVWCSPCWSLHQSGVFDELHNTYGPDGTDELVVLWVEVEGAPLSELQGGGSSQGDWTEGGTWPVPIISSTSVLSPTFSELYAGYVPTVFMACPSGYYKDVTSEAWDGADEVYAEVGTCPQTGDVPVAEISGPTSGFVGSSISFENVGLSVEPITGYAWTFENGTPATSTDETPSVTWNEIGSYEITLVVTNANGDSEMATKTISISSADVDDYHVTFEECLDFATDFSPYNWITLDIDQTQTWGWNGFDFPGESEALPWVIFNPNEMGNPEAVEAYEGSKMAATVASNPSYGPTNDDWLISPLLTLGTESELRFWAKSYTDEYGLERIKVGISTTGNSPEDFTFIQDGAYEEIPTDYTEFVFDLSAYDGQDVYIGLECVSNDASLTFLDNIDVNTTISTDINSISERMIKVYPNPASEYINITNAKNAKVNIYNIVGELIYSTTSYSNNLYVNISDFAEGTYIVKIGTDESSVVTKKITVIK